MRAFPTLARPRKQSRYKNVVNGTMTLSSFHRTAFSSSDVQVNSLVDLSLLAASSTVAGGQHGTLSQHHFAHTCEEVSLFRDAIALMDYLEVGHLV